MIGEADLNNRFTHHSPPTDAVAESYMEIRAEAKELATTIDQLVPDSREKVLAITKLEEVVFWANAGIARNP